MYIVAGFFEAFDSYLSQSALLKCTLTLPLPLTFTTPTPLPHPHMFSGFPLYRIPPIKAFLSLLKWNNTVKVVAGENRTKLHFKHLRKHTKNKQIRHSGRSIQGLDTRKGKDKGFIYRDIQETSTNTVKVNNDSRGGASNKTGKKSSRVMSRSFLLFQTYTAATILQEQGVI